MDKSNIDIDNQIFEVYRRETSEMQAAILNRFKEPLEIKQVDIPQPGPEDVLVKMIACGVCHTDLHLINGGKMCESIFR